MSTWPSVLSALTSRTNLDPSDASWAMREILGGNADDIHIAAFGSLLRSKGETVEELVALVETMREFGQQVNVSDAIDTCGTGGDRSNSINVSTGAAIVAAAAGAKVVKHGNRAASSQCGSADVLEALGVNLSLDAAGVEHCVNVAGIGFCFAPNFHPAMKYAGPARKALGVPTTFNFLGPLANPARARGHALGVSDAQMGERMARTLEQLGAERVMVFAGHNGWDELTTTGPSTVWEMISGELNQREIDPSTLGIEPPQIETLLGGDAETNADVLRGVLQGATGPARDIIVLNAAAAIVVAGLAEELDESLQRAIEVIESGAAAETLDKLVSSSQEVANG